MVARWDDTQTYADLVMIYFTMKPLNKDEQVEVEELMKAKGHETTWDAIRYALRVILRAILLPLVLRVQDGLVFRLGIFPLH
ncbi:uncharacterized protein E0L32_006404 [Thyridium curvatum]|uniref:Uncharacterized protein n=1 Tax=Thyridium curvatum TaxID=1093900 RepID=A0A507B397_9PEZI|nr:uncharacterized protein E0L32_006404 [Thyridium curvatum]TPX13204.1 hypothetical protein E0L32_006404 [Thyridium curvatum]